MSGLNAKVPIQPLTAWWSRRNGAHQHSHCVCTQGGVCASMECLAAAIAARSGGMSRSTLFRRIQTGQITMDEADKWACALGVHPTQIWAGWHSTPVTASMAPHPPAARTLF